MMRYALILALLAGAARADEADLAKRLSDKDSEVVLAALSEAATNQDKRLVSPLVKLLKSDNPLVRRRALEVLALRQGPADKKKAATGIAARLKRLGDKEETQEELMLAIQALHDLAQPATIKALLDGTSQAMARAELEARLMAVGNVPTKEAVDRIIQFGSSGRRGRGNRGAAARKALAYATQMEIPRGDIDVVRKWWSDNRKDFDPVAAADKRAQKRLADEEKRNRKKKRKRKKKADD